jgi:hypothetical protein
MTLGRHLTLLAQGMVVWFLFWLAGLPDYYQQYSTVAIAIGCILLSIAIALVGIAVLQRSRPQKRLQRAVWISFYFTLPFALLDYAYCGVYLGHGRAFVSHYWYLSIFYLTPWLTFVPIALLLRGNSVEPSAA